MVFYFTSNVIEPAAVIYMGIDKTENEELIRWGWPEDVWFHVDKVSSAHVYLRLAPHQSLDDVPCQLIDDCAQLVKANSITGNKMNDINVVYTPWANLKKSGDMAVGQVGFHRQKEVRNVRVEKRLNEIVNRLNKTKVEKTTVDFREEREQRDRAEREDKKAALKEQRKQEEDLKRQREEEQESKSYDRLFTSDKLKSNKDGNDSDDFM